VQSSSSSKIDHPVSPCSGGQLLLLSHISLTDRAFAGRLLDWAQTLLRTTLRIVRKPTGQRGFAVIPRRWAVERTFAWLTAHRRLARDYERDPVVSEAMVRWAAINTITRRIARGGPATRRQRRTFPATG